MNCADRRLAAEKRAQGSLVRLICTASLMRTALTRLLPLTGNAAWWTALACLVPGAAVLAVGLLLLRLTGMQTLTEAMRVCLGRTGAVLVSMTLAALLLLDATASLTALITLFTEGVGTRGTQFTLALLTVGVLLACLHREGLPRAAYLLRWAALAAGAVLLASAAPDMRLDGLFPLGGEGGASVWMAWRAGFSLGWPLMLLLTVEPVPGKHRMPSAVVPCAWCIGLLLALALIVPHELLIRKARLADVLLLPCWYASNALRTLMQCGVMLLLFLAIGGAVQQCAVHGCSAFGGIPAWLPYVIAALLTLTQTGSTAGLWQWLEGIGPYQLLPLALLTLICLPIACLRRRRT